MQFVMAAWKDNLYTFTVFTLNFLWTNLWNIIAKSEPKCWNSVMWNVWSAVYKPLSDHSKSIDPRMLSEKNELTREVERFGINMNTI